MLEVNDCRTKTWLYFVIIPNRISYHGTPTLSQSISTSTWPSQRPTTTTTSRFLFSYFQSKPWTFIPKGPWWWYSCQRAHLTSDDPSSNPADAFIFFCKIVLEKKENKQKRGRGWPTFLKKDLWIENPLRTLQSKKIVWRSHDVPISVQISW